jgi:hypothetical protein
MIKSRGFLELSDSVSPFQDTTFEVVVPFKELYFYETVNHLSEFEDYFKTSLAFEMNAHDLSDC